MPQERKGPLACCSSGCESTIHMNTNFCMTTHTCCRADAHGQAEPEAAHVEGTRTPWLLSTGPRASSLEAKPPRPWPVNKTRTRGVKTRRRHEFSSYGVKQPTHVDLRLGLDHMQGKTRRSIPTLCLTRSVSRLGRSCAILTATSPIPAPAKGTYRRRKV